jgi:hypothetical protein
MGIGFDVMRSRGVRGAFFASRGRNRPEPRVSCGIRQDLLRERLSWRRDEDRAASDFSIQSQRQDRWIALPHGYGLDDGGMAPQDGRRRFTPRTIRHLTSRTGHRQRIPTL